MRQNGAAIKVIRELRGIKTKDMSELLGCTRTKVYRIERELTIASEETLQTIAGHLGLENADAISREKAKET